MAEIIKDMALIQLEQIILGSKSRDPKMPHNGQQWPILSSYSPLKFEPGFYVGRTGRACLRFVNRGPGLSSVTSRETPGVFLLHRAKPLSCPP